ncbi:hypothetical protein [Cupriavidus basilensis]|uniref:hypothetical protein n=1 Tax=Cupriavidus basilensis TaxID=68895 RepID=UPI0007510F0F|nr:hypothetical protein [Cupriavidus basilensis]
MSAVSFVGTDAVTREMLLGPEFRNIEVIDFDCPHGIVIVRIIINLKVVVLYGDPQEALLNYLRVSTGPTELGRA